MTGKKYNNKRSLYQCFQARCLLGEELLCAKGHPLGGKSSETIPYLRLMRGDPLICTVCQKCPDFDDMGEQVTKEDRGWV